MSMPKNIFYILTSLFNIFFFFYKSLESTYSVQVYSICRYEIWGTEMKIDYQRQIRHWYSKNHVKSSLTLNADNRNIAAQWKSFYLSEGYSIYLSVSLWCTRGVVTSELNSDILVGEFEHQPHYYVHFGPRERIDPLIPPGYRLNTCLFSLIEYTCKKTCCINVVMLTKERHGESERVNRKTYIFK